ncbi:hypothetical protein KC730_01995 [Candidatus Kaiserbacteria bacterium]|nr:hypothetical protein [Candidatus Kaiserbacteria bacterium]
MMYNKENLPNYVRTAGKITVVTALSGLLVFIVAFIFDFGAQELNKASAAANGVATTTLIVLNTPPSFTVPAYEVIESSTSTPTNSGDVIQWSAVANDSNSAPYFLLICSTNASPTPNNASGPGFLGTAPPVCGGGTQWGVSASTPSDATATVSTTTTELAPFLEANHWFAWVCDDDPNTPRCNSIPVQGYSATNTSPFHVNNRPVFDPIMTNNGPVDPSGTVTFNSTSSDPDVVGGSDQIYLIICSTNTDYDTNTNTCPNDFLASTTLAGILTDAAATYTVPSVQRDQSYDAFGYLVDEHGHEALNNGQQANFYVNNVAPYVLGAEISLNGGGDMTLSNADAGETQGFSLTFEIHDSNSCLNAASSSEISLDSDDHLVSVFRSNNSTTTCTGAAGDYDPNDCYVNGVATTTWNLVCTADNTCDSPLQDSINYTCSFPLWFLTDPTDAAGTTPLSFANTNWTAGIAGVDDDYATGTMATTTNPVEVISATFIEIAANEIVYGSIAPGDFTANLTSTSTAFNIGNTGLDQSVLGESMCGTFTPSTECAISSTSTINENEQRFSATSSLSFTSPFALVLSSSTPSEVELNVKKSTSTSVYQEGDTYWGINVPISISLSGSYSGLNSFMAVIAEAEDW